MSSTRLKSYGTGRVAFGIAVTLFVIARLAPFAHAHVGLGLDSFDYLGLAKHESLPAMLAAHRPPTYLFFVKLLANSRQLVTWVQFGIAVTSWALLAAVWSRRLQTRGMRIAGVVIVLGLGSCLDVAQWDRLIGTESLSLSLGVLVVTSALWFQEKPAPRRAAALCVAIFLWGMLRDANAIVIGTVGVAIAACLIARRLNARKCFVAIAATCLATVVFSVVSADVGARWQQPVQNVVTFRVLASPEREAYFRRAGLPVTPEEASRLAGRCVNPTGLFLCRKVTDPAFYRWIDEDARSVYLRSWFAFPATTLWEPAAHTHEMIGVRLPLSEITFTGLNATYARSIETVMFPRSSRVLLAWSLVLLVALVVTVRRKGWIPAATLPAVLIPLTYVHLGAVWSGDAVELARHGLAASLQLRLGLWLLTVALIDAQIARAASHEPSHPADVRSPDTVRS